MVNLEELNTTIINEANSILYDYGLLLVLEKYGNPVPWGSYTLGLMTWRDLDIYLETNDMTEPRFFQLGQDVAWYLKPYKMHYRNEFIGETPENPIGFYWGVYSKVLNSPEEWKIDIWSMDSLQLKQHQKEFDNLKSKIDENNRLIILTIKNHFDKHPEYRKSFTSMDIYQSVFNEGITSISEFSQWLKDKKEILSD